jgi:hypothetical protein
MPLLLRLSFTIELITLVPPSLLMCPLASPLARSSWPCHSRFGSLAVAFVHLPNLLAPLRVLLFRVFCVLALVALTPSPWAFRFIFSWLQPSRASSEPAVLAAAAPIVLPGIPLPALRSPPHDTASSSLGDGGTGITAPRFIVPLDCNRQRQQLSPGDFLASKVASRICSI